MKIIALGHYSRTGKDSLANFLMLSLQERNPDFKVKKLPFAWKLKQICYELYAWAGMREPEFYETKEGEPYRDIVLPAIGKTPVAIWIDMGTPAVRNCVYERTWIDYTLKAKHDCDLLIVPDTRFPNEGTAVMEEGDDNILIKVVRPGYGPRKSPADRALLGWNGWHYVVGESGSMHELSMWANKLAYYVLGHAERPEQTQKSREAALAVERIEPWEKDAEVLPPGVSIVDGRAVVA